MGQRLVIGISGASGVIYGIRLLEVLRQSRSIETHLIISKAAKATINQETDWKVRDVETLADFVHTANDNMLMTSEMFDTIGMIVAPCSIKSLSAIAHCYSADLIAHMADFQLKEGKPLILIVREKPLHSGHIRLLQLASQNGAIIMPPVPAFYSRPKTLDDVINNTIGRALSRIGISNDLYLKWLGMQKSSD